MPLRSAVGRRGPPPGARLASRPTRRRLRRCGANYELTGPSALTLAEVAATMSEVLGREIGYVDMPEADFRSLLVEQAGVPAEVVDVEVLLHFAAWKRGDADLVTDTYRELTGKAPTSLAEWVRRNREAFAS